MTYGKILLPAVLVALLGAAGQAQAAGACQAFFTSAQPVPAGWAAAYDLLHISHTPLATIDCTVSATPLTVGEPGDSAVYVYQTAYLWASDATEWTPVALSAAQPAVGGWLTLPAAAPLNLSSGQLNADWNYIAFLSARWNGSRWLIGCGDVACANPLASPPGTAMWSLQAITRQTTLTAAVTPVAPDIADDTPLGATIAMVSCAWSDGSPCTAAFTVSDTSGAYKLSGTNIIVDPAGPGVGAAGSSDALTVTATQ